MNEFPAEFADLLTPRGRRLIDAPPSPEAFRTKGRTPIALLHGLIADRTARACLDLLDRAMYPALRDMRSPIPRESVTGMTENYSERLGKTVRVKTAMLNSPGTAASRAAAGIGLGRMMRSESFRRFAEAVVGTSLGRDYWGRQVICYEAGDYSGPHNDHHPGLETMAHGFVDLHVMFANDAVRSQLLVYEEGGYLSSSEEVARRSGIAVYRLPFWHYTTPLLARPGRESEARRWLLLGTFALDPPPPRLCYRD